MRICAAPSPTPDAFTERLMPWEFVFNALGASRKKRRWDPSPACPSNSCPPSPSRASRCRHSRSHLCAAPRSSAYHPPSPAPSPSRARVPSPGPARAPSPAPATTAPARCRGSGRGRPSTRSDGSARTRRPSAAADLRRTGLRSQARRRGTGCPLEICLVRARLRLHVGSREVRGR